MTTRQTALAGLAFGSCFALGLMGAYAARAAISISRQDHWYQLKKL